MTNKLYKVYVNTFFYLTKEGRGHTLDEASA